MTKPLNFHPLHFAGKTVAFAGMADDVGDGPNTVVIEFTDGSRLTVEPDYVMLPKAATLKISMIFARPGEAAT